MKTVGIDLGYCTTKVRLSSEHAPVSFPSGASEYTSAGFLEPPLLEYANSEKKYVVGSELTSAAGTVQRRHDRDWIDTDLYRMLVHRSLAAVLDPGYSTIKIVTGLPYRFYEVDRERLAKNLGKDHVFYFGDGIYRVNVKDVTVIPQGIGALLDVAVNFAGKIIDSGFMLNRIGILDIGSRTINGVQARKGEIMGSAFSEDLGTWSVVRKIAKAVEQRFPTSQLTPFEIEDAIQKRQISLYGEVHDITDIVEDNIRGGYVDTLIGTISSHWGETSQMDHILLVGGGAYLAGDTLQGKYPHVEVAKQPVFANVNGYIKYGKLYA